ncbi:Os03g0391300 [Oryza sativa Japonica Group]|uniref:Os03g0391300 protein n=2 Tax=Oryza sativa subsp. japonica TaxID=39947 RepID=Q0DRE4_ORYSJ|nr:Os03g0391300 [Oryza sativa Japonica Group]BAS84524.1 Os03g0391300 [Oryza sativa Japonica Group]|eukprot:NP_001050280.1 Os03g0391300 [Oryza sativa Japonica Group]
MEGVPRITYHRLGVDVDHEAAGVLRPHVVGVGVGALRWLVAVPAGDGEALAVAEAEEVEVVGGVGADPLGLDGGVHVPVHHLHGAPLPVQDGLHGVALRHALRPHRHHHVHGEPLAGGDLARDLEGELPRDQVQRVDPLHARHAALAAAPRVRAPQEVLVLDVDEVAGAPDRVDVRVLDAALDHLVLAGHQPRRRGLVGALREPRRRAAVDGAEHLHVPVLRVGLVGVARGHAPVEGDQKAVLAPAGLLAPPLLEVVEHVPGRGALDAAVDVVPWLPRPALGDGRAGEVGLVEVAAVGGVERPEQRVLLRVVPPVAQVDAAEEAHEARRRLPAAAVDDHRLLVVREHGGRLDVLHVAPALVGVPGAEDAVDLGALEVPRRVLVVRRHQPVAADRAETHRRPVVPHQQQHHHALLGLPLEQLAERLRRRRRPPHQHDVGVDGPPGDVHHPPGAADRVEHVLPAPPRLVPPAPGELDARREAVGDVRVLVQPDAAPAALREEGARHALVRAAPDAGAPARRRVGGDAGEPELDAYLVPAVDRAAALAADGEPQVGHRRTGGEALVDGEVGAADERGADGVLGLDGEDDVAGVVRAVDVERLLPPRRARRLHRARPRDAGLVDVHRRIQLAGQRAEADGVLHLLRLHRRRRRVNIIIKIQYNTGLNLMAL